MTLQIKHQSQKFDKPITGMLEYETLYGTRAEVDAFLETVSVGNLDLKPGYQLEKISGAVQAGGTIWEVDLGYSQKITPLGTVISSCGNAPNQHALATRMISIPLEGLKTAYWGAVYRTNWNYALASAPGITASPAWWLTATNLIIASADDAKNYVWLSNENDVANMPRLNGAPWQITHDKQKPGVEAFFFPTYEITEIGTHKNEADAAWVATRKAGEISTPSMGTFGISYGDWLCMGGSVTYDGRNWIATVTYQHSPDGWDTDLYQ